MHIGLDLDNTVLDATTPYLDCFNRISGQFFSKKDIDDFNLYKLYGWNEQDYLAIYEKHGHDIHWNSEPYPHAIETIQKLFHEHQLTIVTARPKVYSEVSIEWLAHYNIPYHNIVFTEDKLSYCLDSAIDVMIDDGPHYAKAFSQKNMPIIVYSQPYNEDLKHDMIYRAKSWDDVYQVIKQINNSLVNNAF